MTQKILKSITTFFKLEEKKKIFKNILNEKSSLYIVEFIMLSQKCHHESKAI